MTTQIKTVVGELRPTQIMFSFGVGALVDLPHLSVLVMGLDDWHPEDGTSRKLQEDRLLQTVQQKLGSQVRELRMPPVPPPTKSIPDPFDAARLVGTPVATFPRWLLCPACQLLAPLGSGLFQFRPNPYHPDRAHYRHEGCERAKNPTAVPARFLVACDHGHLDDFPWIDFVHRGPTNCRSSLRLLEFGPSGEARDLVVHCATCKAQRRMSDAFGQIGKQSMPLCRGRRPHLRDFVEEQCNRPLTAILLGASNLWFPDV
nr:DrmB family protein [Caldilineaceae bacterium]